MFNIEEYFGIVALNFELTGMDYRILLLLMNCEMTTTDLANMLNRKTQNISHCIKTLESRGLIEVSRVHGKNKFYALKDVIGCYV